MFFGADKKTKKTLIAYLRQIGFTPDKRLGEVVDGVFVKQWGRYTNDKDKRKRLRAEFRKDSVEMSETLGVLADSRSVTYDYSMGVESIKQAWSMEFPYISELSN